MNMLNKSRTTFIGFMSEHDIQIPLIQRDYVQGRAIESKEIERRDNFVRKLMDALLSGGKACTLDFIYGARENYGIDNKNTDAPFLPLDGQQRLTTLLLLHWILLQKNKPAKKEEENEKCTVGKTFYKDNIRLLQRFSYKTRISSDRFCQKLVETNFSPDGLIAQIKAKYWYDNNMQADPTVRAMMSMLKLMENMLSEQPYVDDLKGMADRLFDSNASHITFDILDMEQYNLTDGLYVKMNARGKELTPFEHWKADFISILSSNKENRDRFSYGIEHEWNDLFWVDVYKEYVEERKVNNKDVVDYPRIDERFVNFFNNMTRLLFFINTANGNLKAEDYKQGLWATVSEIYKSPNTQNELFDILDTLSAISQNNGEEGVSAFFEDLFYTTRSSDWSNHTAKVKMFVDATNINLLNIISGSDDFKWTHVLLYAIVLYCKKHKQYVVDDNLRNYVRICNHYLYEHNYLDKGGVSIVAQVRANEMHEYAKTFAYLCTDINPFVSLAASTQDGYITKEQNKLKYYNDAEVLPLVRKLEDMSCTYGNLGAFTSLLDMCLSDHTLCQKVWDAMFAFHNAPGFQKAQALVAFDYRGLFLNMCSYGHRVFIGSSFKTDHWMVHFRAKDNGKAMDDWSQKYVRTFIECGDIETTISGQIPESPTSLKDYMLKYDDILAAQVWWRKDKNKAPFYYAMPNPWNDFDMIAIHSFSSRPLGNSYQTCPMANAVVRKLCDHDQLIESGQLGHCGHGATKSAIIITKDRGWDNHVFSLKFGSENWHTDSNCYSNLNQALQGRFIQHPTNSEDYILTITDGRDLISEAVDLLDSVIVYLKDNHQL